MFSAELSPFNAPNYDVFVPARRSDSRGVILGAPLDGGQSYVPWIGLTTIRELALKHEDKVGLVDRALLDGADELVKNLMAQVETLQARVTELETTQERITGLAQQGYRVQRIQGRPKQKVSK